MAESIYERIHRELDIVEVIGEYLPLAKKGRSFVGLCPFHADKDPSMSVSPSKQVYNCFSCGAKGDVISFVANYEKTSREAAVSKLAARLGLTYEIKASTPLYNSAERALLDALLEANTFFAYNLDLATHQKALNYAAARGLDKALRSAFKIGYAPSGLALKTLLEAKGHDEATLLNASLINSRGESFFANRLVFGITNEHGDIVAFSARTLTNEGPKYVNSAESIVFHKNALLYNFFNARAAIERERQIIICEGQMDVIALTRAGINHAVATMGTALTPEHLNLIKLGTAVVLNFDADTAGQAATFKALNLLLPARYQVSIVDNTLAKDADEIMANEGAPALRALITGAISALVWTYEHALKALVRRDDIASLNAFFKQIALAYFSAEPLAQELIKTRLEHDLKLSAKAVTDALEVARASLTFSPRALSTAAPSQADVPSNAFTPEIPPDLASEQTRHVALRQPLRASYMLVKSMLTNPSLVRYYQAHAKTIFLAETQLASLARYLANNEISATVQVLPEALAPIMAKLNDEKILSVKTEGEFQELIERVNIEFYNYYISFYLEQLKGPLSISQITEINQAISQLKAKKEEIYDKK